MNIDGAAHLSNFANKQENYTVVRYHCGKSLFFFVICVKWLFSKSKITLGLKVKELLHWN